MSAAALDDERPLVRSGPIAFARVLRNYKIWLFVSSVFLIAALTFVIPVYDELRRLLDQLPTADGYFGSMLLDEVERLHPNSMPELGAYGLVAMLLWTFFGGGACAIADGRSLKLADFLVTCSRYFFRSLRSWLVFVVALLLWSWVWHDVLVPFFETEFEAGGNSQKMFRFEVAAEVIFAVGLIKLLILRRLALARMVLDDRRSALRAWLSGVGYLVFHPIRTVLGFFGVGLIGAIGLVSCSYALVGLSGNYVLGFCVAVLVLVIYQVSLLASFAVARLLLETENAHRAVEGPEDATVAETSNPLLLG